MITCCCSLHNLGVIAGLLTFCVDVELILFDDEEEFTGMVNDDDVELAIVLFVRLDVCDDGVVVLDDVSAHSSSDFFFLSSQI